MTNTVHTTISRKHLIDACERWCSLTPQKRAALLRKNTVEGWGGIMRWLIDGKQATYVVFKQRSIVVTALVDDGQGGTISHSWCYKRRA